MGAMFSVLALKYVPMLEPFSSTLTFRSKPLKMKINGTSLGANNTSGPASGGEQTGTRGQGTKSEVGVIAGVIGGVAIIGFFCLGVFFYKRRTRREMRTSPHPYVVMERRAQRVPSTLKGSAGLPHFEYDTPSLETETGATIQQEDDSPVSNGFNALTGLQTNVIRREIARYLEDRSSLLEPPSYASGLPR